jgi:hypothetical protein
LQSLGFSWPTFENETGPKPTFFGPKLFFVSTNLTQISQNPNKNGPNPVLNLEKWAKRKSPCGAHSFEI